MKKKNKFNFTIMYIGQNEKRTLIGIESRIPRSRDRRLHQYTMSDADRMVATFLPTVPRVLNLLWTWNFCCKLEIVCADGTPL
jgi:hypothetical protein